MTSHGRHAGCRTGANYAASRGADLTAAPTLDDGSHPASSPSVAWTGTEYVVAWRDKRDGEHGEIYFARITPCR
jgi:hypothetical protein